MGWRELEALLPNLFVVGTVILLLASRMFAHLRHKQATEIVMKLLEIDPGTDIEAIKAITQPAIHPLADLRRGVLLLGIALACAVFSQSMIDPEYKAALLGLSAFPGLIGLIYLVFHCLPKTDTSNSTN